jgi:hypothetical protein
VTRGDEFGANTVGIVKQLAELDPVVAHDTGIGSAPDRVFLDKVIDDLAKF